MTEHEQPYLSTEELAARWNMSPQTLRNWRLDKRGPRYFKPSGKYGPALYRVAEVEAYEKKHSMGGTA